MELQGQKKLEDCCKINVDGRRCKMKEMQD